VPREHLTPHSVIDLLTGLGKFTGEAVEADADAEDEPATAEPVECRGLPGDLDRPAAGQRRDHGANAHAFGRGGDARHRDPRVGDLLDRRVPAHMVPDKDPVPAGLLRLGGQPRAHRRVGKSVEERQVDGRADTGAVGVPAW